MPLDDLFELRTASEEAIRATFVAMQFTAITRANAPVDFQKARPRIEIKCSIGAATGHRFFCPDNIARYDRWRLSLALQCITAPDNDGTSALHEVFTSRVRNTVATLAQQSWSDLVNFPLHRLAEPFRDTGDQSTLKTEEGVEYTVLSFSNVICIRETAWTLS